MKKTYYSLRYTMQRKGKYGDTYSKCYSDYAHVITYLNQLFKVYNNDLDKINIEIDKFVKYE